MNYNRSKRCKNWHRYQEELVLRFPLCFQYQYLQPRTGYTDPTHHLNSVYKYFEIVENLQPSGVRIGWHITILGLSSSTRHITSWFIYCKVGFASINLCLVFIAWFQISVAYLLIFWQLTFSIYAFISGGNYNFTRSFQARVKYKCCNLKT